MAIITRSSTRVRSIASRERAVYIRRVAVVRAVHKKLTPQVSIIKLKTVSRLTIASLLETPLQELHRLALALKMAKVSDTEYRVHMLKAQLAVQTAKLRREKEGRLLKGQFSFRSLPGELRNRIWEQALYEPRELCLDTMRCPPLAMVSHDMMREALPIFLAVNTFHVVFLKKIDGSRYEMGILPQTLAWLQGIHEHTFNNITYKEFLTKVVFIKHLTFTYINKVENLNSEDYKEIRIDYDYAEQSEEKKTHLATKSMNRIPQKRWVTHSTDANII